MKRNLGALALLSLSLMILSCGGKQAQVQVQQAQLQAMNASPDAGTVNVLVNNSAVFPNLLYAEAPAFGGHAQPVGAGDDRISVSDAQNSALLVAGTSTFNAGQSYRLLVAGQKMDNSLSTIVLTDGSDSPSQPMVRFVNVSPTAGAVDIYVGDGLGLPKSPTIANLGFKSASNFVPYPLSASPLSVTSSLCVTAAGVTPNDLHSCTLFGEGFGLSAAKSFDLILLDHPSGTGCLGCFYGSAINVAVWSK